MVGGDTDHGGNNPIYFIDPDGNTVEVSGVDRDKFLARINSTASVQFKYNDKNQLVAVDSKATADDVFTSSLLGAIGNKQTIGLRLVNDDELFVDEFTNGKVDVGDLLGMGNEMFQTNLLHVVTERIETPDYEKNKNSTDESVYDKAHDKALKKEEAFMKEKHPGANIKYKSDDFDEKSRTTNKAGQKTINCVFDFGGVQQIYTHPINKKGEIRDGIIKSSQIRVVPNKKKK